MRTVIIGDVHGSYDALTRIISKVGFDEENDRLINIGDMMDRGAAPRKVFLFFKEKKEAMRDNCILIRGNHEQMMLDSYHDSSNLPLWMSNGAEQTIRSFEDEGESVYDQAEWIQDNTVLYYLDEEGFQCVHADIFNEDPALNEPDTLIWGRNNVTYGYYTGRLTIVGHTPLVCPIYLPGGGREPVCFEDGDRFALPATGMIGIDTGCVFGYKLTALVIDNGICRISQEPLEE